MAFTYEDASRLLHGFDRENERIIALKFVRERTMCDLPTAKAIVDSAWGSGTVRFLLEQMVAAGRNQDTLASAPVPTCVPAPFFHDAELATICSIYESINGLDTAAKRTRVLQYIISRFGYEVG